MLYQTLSSNPAAWRLDGGALVRDRLDAGYYTPKYLDVAARLRTLGVPVQPFKKLCSKLNCGSTPKQVEYGPAGMPLIRTTNVRPNHYDDSDVQRVAGLNLPASSNIVIVPGDVLYTMSGTIGFAAVYPAGLERASCSNTIARGRIDPASGHDAYYVAAFLNSSLGYSQSLRLVSGGVLAHVMPNSVKELLVATPAPAVQRAIGNKLRKAEQLREIGRRALSRAESRLQELTGRFEQSAQRTSWVGANTFEFARLDAEFYQPHYLVAARWFDENRTDRLEDLMISGSYGVLPESEDYGRGDMRFLRATDVGHLFVNHEDALTVPREYAHPKGTAHEGDVLLEVKGMISGGAVCPKEAEGYLVNGSIFLIRPKETVDPHYLAAVLVGPAGIVQKQRASSNSVISYVSLEFLRALRIPRFGSDVETAIGKDVRLFEKSRREAILLTKSATTAVEALIAGLLDEAALLAESDAIEAWLVANPSPDAKA